MWGFLENNWESILVWGEKNLGGKGLRTAICKVALGAIEYQI